MTVDGSALSVLEPADIQLGCTAASMEEAIEFVGRRLVERGSVDEAYIEGMKLRETVMSTYLGNGVALPHGILESKEHILRTGITVAQYPAGVDWQQGTARIVVGLAAVGDDHVAVLSQLADVLQDEDLCELFATTDDVTVIHTHLTAEVDEEDD
ncbi:MAG: PTS sugar transporter subunit IIA [Actinomycetota bacterium]